MIRHRTGPPLRRHYGPGPHQHGHLHVSRADPEQGVIVLFHGGFWRPHRDLSMTTPMAHALAAEGWNVWNVEYRRTGQGTWRETLEDCAAAIAHVRVLADELGIDTRTMLSVGHSAGGQLAAWVAGLDIADLEVAGLVSLNGVLDMTHAADEGVGDDAVRGFLGSLPDERPDRYREVDPTARAPLGVPSRCLHSRTDERVPFAMSERFAHTMQHHGDDSLLVEIPGLHTAPIEVGSHAWPTVLDTISSLGRTAGDPSPLRRKCTHP